MIKPETPSNESYRQKEVEKYKLLDTLPEGAYDTFTRLLAHICDVPISLVSLLDNDRNFLKSHHGIDLSEDPRDRSFCGHAIIDNNDIMIVEDATLDIRFQGNPLVDEMGVKFYAGAPLVNPNGYKLGTLCVFDFKPRKLSDQQIQAVIDLSKNVMLIMEERYKNIKMMEKEAELTERNKELKKFTSVAAHDLKSPLSNIIGLASLLKESLKAKIDEENYHFISLIQESGESLKDYINGLQKYYNSEDFLQGEEVEVNTSEFAAEIKSIFATERDTAINFSFKEDTIKIKKNALKQILVNLITNGLKYNSKKERKIEVQIVFTRDKYQIEVIDNGDGMTTKELNNAFKLFETSDKIDRNGKKGTGIGLNTVQKMVEKLGGTITIESTPKKGTSVKFDLPKA